MMLALKAEFLLLNSLVLDTGVFLSFTCSSDALASF